MDFKSIANKKLDVIEKPALPPIGTYRWQITKLPEQREVSSEKGSWDALEFQLRAVEALDNVDMDGYKGKVESITQRLSFMFDKNDEANFERTLFRLKKFLIDHVKCADESMALNEAINASVGGQFLGDLRWDEDKRNPGEFNANIAKTAPLD